MAKQKLNVDTSIVDYLKSVGQDSSYQARKKLAQQLNIPNYKGTAEQNTSMLNMLKTETQKPVTPPKVPKAVQPTTQPVVQPVARPTQPTTKPATLPINQEQQEPEIQSMSLNAPAQYESPYSAQIESILNNIINRQPFSYNVNADPIYNQYKDAYTQSGNLAMRDTMGNAAALTGGYGSSYGQTVGQQAYNQHMGQLNNVIPELYQAAYGRYQNEGNNLLNNLSALQGMEQQAYNQHRDNVGDYQSDRAFDYNRQMDEQSQANWNRQFDHGVSQDALAQQNYEREFDYRAGQNAIAQDNWNRQFEHNVGQDEQAQSNWNRQFDYGVNQDAQNRRDYLNELAQSQANLDRQFEYNKQQDTIDRESALSQYYREQAAKTSKAEAEASTKRVNDAMDRTEDMIKSTDMFGNLQYEPQQVFEYLLDRKDLTDEEVYIIANTIYELRPFLEE